MVICDVGTVDTCEMLEPFNVSKKKIRKPPNVTIKYSFMTLVLPNVILKPSNLSIKK